MHKTITALLLATLPFTALAEEMICLDEVTRLVCESEEVILQDIGQLLGLDPALLSAPQSNYLGEDLRKLPFQYRWDKPHEPEWKPSVFVAAERIRFEEGGRQFEACRIHLAESDIGTIDDMRPGEDGFPTQIFDGQVIVPLNLLEKALQRPGEPCVRSGAGT